MELKMSEDYDVVLATLKEKRDQLWRMTERNMRSEYIGMNIMDDIRLDQIQQLEEAMQMWQARANDTKD